MSPQAEQRIKDLERKVEALMTVRDVTFIEELKRRLDYLPSTATLTDLADVALVSPSNGQVLKYNGTEWAEGNDEIA